MVGSNDEENKTLVDKLWSNFDANGNGSVSLAEADLAFRRIGGPLMAVYYTKKVLLMAFGKARN